MAVSVDTDVCVGCGVCVEECPNEALEVSGEVVTVDEDACIECGICVDACPMGSLEL